jgi:hypothetical protein
MFHKYIKLILVSTALLQAAPKVFNSLGNELELFQKDCQTFQKISMISSEIQKECNAFHFQANNAFKTGYKLDSYVDSDYINEKALNRYLSLLRNLDNRKEKILGLVYVEIRKARKENNFSYYGELIENYKVKLYDSDYEFMGKHKKVFSKNTRYIANSNYIQYLEEERLKKAKAKKKRREKNILQNELPIGLMDHVSPKAFNSLGNELEAFKEDCQTFQKITKLPASIQESCNKYYMQLNKAFEVGYKLDPSVEQENVNEKELHKYLFMLRHLDKRKENILGQIYAEARKARNENKFSYYWELTANYKVKLYGSDYGYMEKYKKIFGKNARYISHNKHLQSLEEEGLKKEKAKRGQYKIKKHKNYRVN